MTLKGVANTFVLALRVLVRAALVSLVALFAFGHLALSMNWLTIKWEEGAAPTFLDRHLDLVAFGIGTIVLAWSVRLEWQSHRGSESPSEAGGH